MLTAAFDVLFSWQVDRRIGIYRMGQNLMSDIINSVYLKQFIRILSPRRRLQPIDLRILGLSALHETVTLTFNLLISNIQFSQYQV